VRRMEQKTILKYETVALDDENSVLVILDQTALPNEIHLLHLATQKEIWDAIHSLQVRGAPAIGVAAGFGIYLAAKQLQTLQYSEFLNRFQQAKAYLDSARPTAVNLSWALNRMERIVTENAQRPVGEIVSLLHLECVDIKDEDVQTCRRIGEIGLTLIRDGDGILTHCNAGQLATSRYGTALAPIHVGRERGMNFRVYTDETRPLLQGARLSAFELLADGVDTTVICDNMASQVMKNGWIQAVFVGCDRVAANGDVCNKIGTSGVAVLAKYYKIPFYVFGPTSTIDMQTARGEDIPIEQRPEEEVTERWYRRRMAPEGVHVYNPAFDVTPNELVTAIVTECGIARPPYPESLRKNEKIKENPARPLHS
jgi:methylthioribose-1-phosphate isomerase